MKNLPIHIKIVLSIIVIAILYKGVVSIVNPGIDLYNNTKKLELAYNKETQTQITNYDGYYLAFMDKQKNADFVTKEVFITVTTIIMENRRDGDNVAWKWLQENQQIPYSEFTVFYKELSAFISSRYADNMAIERRKQEIVEQHNMLISTFPNTFYNKFIGIKPLTYKFGYISNMTKERFK